jgi:hypothetical protein
LNWFSGQFNWSLTPLTSDQQSASQTGQQVDRVVRGGSIVPSSRAVQPVLVNLTSPRSRLPVRLADRLTGLPKRFNRFSKEVQPVLVNLTSLRSSLPVRLADSLPVRLADSLPGLPGAVQPVLDRVLAQTASFEAPSIYTDSYLSPHSREHNLNSISNLRNTSHSLSLASPISNL